MVRVLHIMGCSDVGGISTVVLNYYRCIDRSKIHFDIALTVDFMGKNAHALQELGAEVFFLPMKSEGLGAFCRGLENLLKERHYDAVHVHESETCYVALRVAKKMGVPCRAAHCHTTSPYEGLKGEVRRLSGCVLNYHYATHVIGCGQLAGERVFGKHNMKRKKAMVLPNAVDAEAFSYDAQVRREVRKELNVEDRFVIGMVGRLDELKNYPFAFERMKEILKKIPNAVLIAAGNGPEEAKLRARIQELGLEEYVKLLGRRSDVARLYQGFDLFLMPSLSEGFPVAAVEALAAGLPALLSDTITRELSFGSAVEYLPLSEPERWIRAIEKWQDPGDRAERQKEVAANGLDIHQTAKMLEQVYLGKTY